MNRRCLLFLLLLLLPPTPPVHAEELTLQKIMARDWIGTAPENPRFSDDGRSLVYEKRRPQTEIVDLYRVEIASGKTQRVEDRDRGSVDPAEAVWSRDRRVKAFVRDGDLFYRELGRGELHQVTRTAEAESSPLVLLDGRIAFRAADSFLAFDPKRGTVATLAELRLADDPEIEKPKSSLDRQQQRYFGVLRERKQRRDDAKQVERERRAADPTRAPEPWYLGMGLALLDAALSPDGRHLAVVLGPERDASEDDEQGADGGKPDKMPLFVTESGYVDVRDVRPKVGTGKPETPRFALLDLAAHERHDLDLTTLPGIHDDPLADLRAKADAARKALEQSEAEAKAKESPAAKTAKEGEADAQDEAATKAAAKTEEDAETEAETAQRGKTEKENEKEEAEKKAAEPAKAETEAETPKAEAAKPTPRIVSPGTLVWSEDGRRLAAFVYSYDNKDRWLVAVDASPAGGAPRLEVLERLTDPAWINWRFNELGWTRDGESVWYLSEASGHSHLYLRPLAGDARQLTSGSFEIDTPRLARDGKSFVVAANREHPGIVEAYRVDVASGALTRLSARGGLLDALVVSRDERQIAFLGSGIDAPPELFAQAAKAGATAQKLTASTTPEFEAVDWALPEVVSIRSSHSAAAVWARVYKPADWSAAKRYPAVAFVHGAGYLQNVHHGWSSYFREFMFHSMLVRRGYVVIDMDYRGSSGYGRDWRTAIYRQMGWPEVEDYQDGLAWLVAERAVDPARVGVYGGSYGGFFTFMALFTKPEMFAAGAALRPVSDWAHYNHGYTANILNTPEVDPEAYAKSSPIEYAEGLRKPLLILHGMADDNVTFQDSVRLVQRLIELGKTDWFETAIYPLEPHGFKEPSSWVDEYRRIWNLFERTLWK